MDQSRGFYLYRTPDDREGRTVVNKSTKTNIFVRLRIHRKSHLFRSHEVERRPFYRRL